MTDEENQHAVGASRLSVGLGGALDILDCMQDRPVADGKAVLKKCVRLPKQDKWDVSKHGTGPFSDDADW